jgi:glycosyltransferase involved in cell wall biosynthesis
MPKNSSASNMEQTLTIVIPCKNEEQYIGKLLQDLYFQRIGKTRIIVADAHSTDGTRSIVEHWKNSLNIEIIDGGTVSYGRNTGAQLATTPFVLFIDADVRFFNDLVVIRDALETIVYEQLDLVALRAKSYAKDWRASILFTIFNVVNRIMSKTTPFAVGAFFLTRKSTFDALGGFPDTYTTSEDYLLSKQYHPTKFKILDHHFGQDDRRFKKMGYIGMMKYMITNFFNRNNPEHFINPNIKYWE